MKLKEVYSDDNAKIETNSRKKFIQVTWLQHTTGEALKTVLRTAMQYILSERLTRWLCDMRKLSYLGLSDNQWIAKTIFSLFAPELRCKLAYVVTSSFIYLTHGIKTHELVSQDPERYYYIKTDVFLHYDSAHEWLER